MRQMKKALVILGFIFTAGFVQADVLYWQLAGTGSESFLSAYGNALSQAPDLPKDGKTLVMRLFSTDLPAGSSGTISSAAEGSYIKDASAVVEYNGDLKVFENSAIATLIGSGSSLSFGVELGVLNADESITALYISDVVSYGKLSEMGAIQDMVTTGYDKAWNLANYNWHAVPEPTSGVLMLLGCSILLIRRKRYA